VLCNNKILVAEINCTEFVGLLLSIHDIRLEALNMVQ